MPNAVPSETWFVVDLRAVDTPTKDRLRSAVIDSARRAADAEHVGFRVEHTVLEDYVDRCSDDALIRNQHLACARRLASGALE